MVSIPTNLLACSTVGDEVVPQYLTELDLPWLRNLLDEFEQYVGQPRQLLERRLRMTGDRRAPPQKRAMAAHVLFQCFGDRIEAVARPSRLRLLVFREAARAHSPEDAVGQIAAELGASPEAVMSSLLADLPPERRLGSPSERMNPWRVALLCNLALAQGILRQSVEVEVKLEGNARSVVRLAKLHGLMCSMAPPAKDESRATTPALASHATLVFSGPLALFRRSNMYGRALGRIVPQLFWCRRFRLRARCRFGSEELTYVIGDGDPILPAREPKRYDSKVESRLALDLAKACPDWDLVREPRPVEAHGRLIFPDFALIRQNPPRRTWMLEIVGFWTEAYLEEKLGALRAARIENLILCIDLDKDCGGQGLPEAGPILWFRGRVDPALVRRILEESG